MSELVRLEGKHTTQRAHCALVSQPISQFVTKVDNGWILIKMWTKNVDMVHESQIFHTTPAQIRSTVRSHKQIEVNDWNVRFLLSSLCGVLVICRRV